MKIKFFENHQLPKDYDFIFTDYDIKEIFNNLMELGVWKSNNTYKFDKSYSRKRPKITGYAITALSISYQNNIFFHLYGSKKEILKKISIHEIKNILIPKLQSWLEEKLKLNRLMPNHRMIIFEVDPNNGKLKFHELG